MASPSRRHIRTEPPGPRRRHLRRLAKATTHPTHIRLDRVFRILERTPLRAGWREHLGGAVDAYQDAQGVREYQIEDPDIRRTTAEQAPTWIQPREAFRLWAYGSVIHREYAKELRWKRLGPLSQGPVRHMAHDYAATLLDEAEFLTRLLRHGVEGSIDDLD